MEIKRELPLLPLRDIVVFPSMVIPLFVGRDKSISALNDAMENDKKSLSRKADLFHISSFLVGKPKKYF